MGFKIFWVVWTVVFLSTCSAMVVSGMPDCGKSGAPPICVLSK